jgi:aspartyl-tRNA(Asn)/glutamyl-tRNA(Gln) amidotransferase subunit C
MKLSLEQVDKIAALARLELSEEERASFARQLSSIIEYVDKLQAVDTKDVEPMSHSVAMGNVLREDEVIDRDDGTRLKMIEAFPEKEGDLLKVKAVFS